MRAAKTARRENYLFWLFWICPSRRMAEESICLSCSFSSPGNLSGLQHMT